MSMLDEYCFIKTDGENPDFARLCDKLDQNLDELVGGRVQRQKYVKYNQRESIHDVILVYKDEQAVACGSYKFYDKETVELKRIFTDYSIRGTGIGKELVKRLEADAKAAGYRYAILETGKVLTPACGLYKSLGYQKIPNYGQYVDMPESICMKKEL